MLSSITRSERVIIVEDDRIRSVVIGPKQRLRPAVFVALACTGMAIACLGWGLTAAELFRTRQTASFMEEGSKALATQLADSRSRIAALGNELEGARQALTTVLEGEQQVHASIAAALARLTVEDTKDNAQAARTLRAALVAARDELTPLAALQDGQLSAAVRSLDNVELASRQLAVRRAQAAVAAVEMAAARADAPGSGDTDVTAEGLAMALSEARGESARLRAEKAEALAVRDIALKTASDTERRMAAMTDSQVELLSHLTEQTDLGIDRIESALAQTGLDLDQVLAQLDDSRFGQGGPLLTLATLQQDLLPPAASQALATLESRMDRQARLKALTHLLPLSAPADDFYVTSRYGKRLDPFTNQRAKHEGVDLVAKYRSPILATAPGIVVETGYDRGGYGRMVLVDHGFGIRTRYAHLDKITVKTGDTVSLSQQVGTLGNTGRSSGPHLHYEVIIDGKPVDPLRFMERGRHVCQG